MLLCVNVGIIVGNGLISCYLDDDLFFGGDGIYGCCIFFFDGEFDI